MDFFAGFLSRRHKPNVRCLNGIKFTGPMLIYFSYLISDSKHLVMQFRRVQCTKVLFCLTTFCLVLAYVQKLIIYVYHKFEVVQPPWPSQLPRMVEYNAIAREDLNYEPTILCWISSYPKNRLVRTEKNVRKNFTFFSLL